MSAYLAALREAMSLLADHGAVFLGQAVRYPGTAMYNTLDHIPEHQRIELPVAESMQLGMCTGIALAGGLPVSIYPRINFLLEATSQLVSHLDKLPLYSGYRPRVIIRTAVAHDKPMDPGPQHLGDYSYALENMLTTVVITRLHHASDIGPAYQAALERDGSTLLVEYARLYDE